MSPYPSKAYLAPWLLGRAGFAYPLTYPIWAKHYDKGLSEQTKEVFREAGGKGKEIAPDVEVELKISEGQPAEKFLDESEEDDY
jgi:hypothetical protein